SSGSDERLVGVDRLLVLVRLVQRLRAGERPFEPRPLVGRDAARQEAGIDSEAGGQPPERLRPRARLAAPDLWDVLLREAIARELALRQACCDAKLAQPLPEAYALGAGLASCAAGGVAHRHVWWRLVKRILH